MAENRVIGNRGAIPWSIPSDQELFKKITMGHPIILGRTTFETIGRALPGRMNIVLTRKRDYQAEGIVIAHSIEDAFASCRNADEVFICGGSIVFHETIALADRIYLSVIHRSYEGDALFPEIPADLTERTRKEIADTPPYSFIRYERAE